MDHLCHNETKEEQELDRFDFVLLYASSISQLKQKTKAIINLIHENTVVFINSSFCVLLEPLINEILPTTLVFSIIGNFDIKRFAENKFFVNTGSMVIFIGLSCHNVDKKLVRLMSSVPKKSFDILKSQDKNTQVDKFIRYLRFSKISSVYKLSSSGKKNSLGYEIWSRIMKFLIYDCFAIIYNESDIYDLFYNQVLAPPIRNIFEETIILSRLCGNHDFLIKQKQKMDFMSDLIQFFQNEKKKSSLQILQLLSPEELNQFPKSIIHFPQCLFNNIMNYETNLSMLISQLILISTEINADIPTLEFLNSILLRGATGVKQRPYKIAHYQKQTMLNNKNNSNNNNNKNINKYSVQKTNNERYNEQNIAEEIKQVKRNTKIDAQIINKTLSNSEEDEEEDDDTYESANSSIDPTLQNLYQNQLVFLDYNSGASNRTNETYKKATRHAKIEFQEMTKSEQPTPKVQESTKSTETEYNNDVLNFKSSEPNNNSSAPPESETSFDYKNLEYFNFNEGPPVMIRSSSRECDYEIEDYIDSPYYQEQIDLSVIRSKKSHGHGHKLKNMVLENSSTSSRRGYRKNNPKSRNKDSQFVNHNKIIETLRSASANDAENRYGALDSTAAVLEEKMRDKNKELN